jgi:ribosome maturation factor RimP
MNKNDIEFVVSSYLEGKLTFLVEVEVRKGNVIDVYLDSDKGVDISECVEITRLIESKFDRDKEDYELRVSSPGLERPFKLLRQYNKYVGREIKILANDNRKMEGELKTLSESGIEILIKAGKKGSDLKTEKLLFSDIKEAMPLISFKSKLDNNKN